MLKQQSLSFFFFFLGAQGGRVQMCTSNVCWGTKFGRNNYLDTNFNFFLFNFEVCSLQILCNLTLLRREETTQGISFFFFLFLFFLLFFGVVFVFFVFFFNHIVCVCLLPWGLW